LIAISLDLRDLYFYLNTNDNDSHLCLSGEGN